MIETSNKNKLIKDHELNDTVDILKASSNRKGNVTVRSGVR